MTCMSGRSCLGQGLRGLGERLQQFPVHRHQTGLQLHCQGDEFAVIGRAVARGHQLQHGGGIDCVFRPGQQASRLGLQGDGLFDRQEPAAQIPCQDVAEFAAPRQRRCPVRIVGQQPFGSNRIWPGQVQIGEDVAIDDDQRGLRV